MNNYQNITKEELIIAFEELQQLNNLLVSSHKKKEKKHDKEEKKLHKKDLLFRKLSANVPDLIYQFTRRTDGSYFVPIASEGIVNIFGCSPEDVLNDFTPIANVIYPEDAERVINDIEYSAKHLTYFTCEFRVQLPGKEIQWILSKSTPEKLPDGSVTWYGFNANITEQKKAEEKLKNASLLLQSSIESPKDMIILSIDKNYNYLSFNECHRLAMLHAYDQEVKIGMNLLECITSEEDKIKSKINYDKALNGESHITIEEYGELKKAYYETRYNPIFNDKNEIIGTTAFSADITERKQAEELVREREYLLSSSQRAAHVGTWSWKVGDTTTYWSDETYRIYGLSPEMGAPSFEFFFEIIHPEDRPKMQEWPTLLIAGLHPPPIEFRVMHPDGIYRVIQTNGAVIETVDGVPTRIAGTAYDITERKQAEEKLRESEYRFRKLYEDGAIGMVMVGKDFKFLAANRSFCQMVGYQEEELQQLTGLDITHPDDKDKDIPQVKKLMTREIDVYKTEKRFLNKNGQTIWAQITPTPIYDSNGQFLYILGIIVNVTERKKAEEILEESYALIKIAEKIAKLGGWSVNLEDNRCYWSNEVAVIHEVPVGYSPLVEEGIGFYAPEWRDKITEVFTNCAQNGVPYDEEMQILTSKGKRVWVKTTGEAVKDSSGKIVKVQGAFQDISERKIAEETLRDSETKLKRILNNLQDAYLQADLEGNITFANTTAAKIYGYANIQEMLGLPTSNLYKDKKDREKLTEGLSKSEKISDIIGEGLKKDGTTFWVSISVQYLKDNQGKIIGTEGLIRDISDRKQTEDQIRKLSQAVEQSPTSIILTDIKGNVEYANPKALKITGYTLEEVKGKNPRIFSSGEKPKNEYENLWKTILAGKEWRGEFHNKKKNGDLYWELASISPIINEKGEIINLLAVKEDITERKQILDDLIVAKEHAEKSEIRLLEAQKITKVGSWETDLSNLKVIWSDETYQIFEISSNIFQATHQAFLNFVHPDDKKIVDEAFAKSFETKAYNSIEHRIITAKDTIKYVEQRWKIVFNDQEKPTRAVGTCQDITERKHAEQELKEAKEKAEESDRLKSAFLANMSHEIRTPMNGILGFAGLLKEPGISGEKQQKYIEIIQKSGDRMLNIINDIVDISKIESGQMEVYITETDINEKIENLYQFFKPEAEAKNIQFSIKNTLPKNEAIITTDAEKVYAILSNLLKNAIKFTNEGEIEFGVAYESAATRKKQLKFFVKDTGMGIAKDRQQAIFERFIQADIYDKMALQGAGLGLSISKAYVEMLGGKIWVESEEGIGSAFYFTIPCHNETENVFVQDDDASIKNEHEPGKLKILIAEDDESSQILLSTIVEAYASEIFIANNGMEAVEIYKHHPDIDLILMDIQMPKLDGYEATSQIRQLSKKVVIIAQTAYALSYDRQKVMEVGCDDYLPKPILMDDLKTLIRKYFAQEVN